MPEMAQRLEALRTYIRDEASLPQKLQELVMISVAREMRCAFIWYAHAAAARQAGVRGDVVDSIRERRSPANLDPRSRPWWTSPASSSRAARSADPRSMPPPPVRAAGTMTLTNLISCYAVLAYNMNTYELEAPTHPTEPALPL